MEPSETRPPRRRRRRGKRRDDRQPESDRTGPNASKEAAHPVLPPRTVFDNSKPADTALTPDERAELKQHFAFLARFREALRLKLNATEDLIVNGARAPEERGVCHHLLGKVDRACVTAAISRLKDAEQRTRFLGGVVRFTRDVAIVILYLESLSASAPRAEAAATLVAALRQIDFAGVSAAQMRRLLDLVVSLLTAEDRPHFVLSLLRSPSFRTAFDHTADVLPTELVELFLPMRAAFGQMFAEERETADPVSLRRGVRILLAAPRSHLTGLPEQARGRLLEAALDLPDTGDDIDQAITALLNTLPKSGRFFSQMATKRARQLLRSDRDNLARPILERLKEAQPDYKIPNRWLEALAAPRVGRVALLDKAPAGPGFHSGFWITRQKSVWVVVGTPVDADAFAAAADTHRALALPGLQPLLLSGNGADGVPYFGLPRTGEPVQRGLRELGRDPPTALDCARSGVEILIALSLAGVAVPDAGSERFLVDSQGRLLLANLVGCRRDAPDLALAGHLEPGRTLVSGVLDSVAGPHAFADLRQRLMAAESLLAMARLLVDQE